MSLHQEAGQFWKSTKVILQNVTPSSSGKIVASTTPIIDLRRKVGSQISRSNQKLCQIDEPDNMNVIE